MVASGPCHTTVDTPTEPHNVADPHAAVKVHTVTHDVAI